MSKSIQFPTRKIFSTLFIIALLLGITLSLTPAQAGEAGNCLDFDGTSDYAYGNGVSNSLHNITLEAWVYHYTLPEDQQRYVTVASEVAVIRHDGASQQNQLHFYIKTDDGFRSIRVNGALQTGRWYHVAGTWDGADMKLYLNGELVGEYTPGATITMNIPSGNLVLSSGGETMDGYIDEVRIWNTARTQAEIRESMLTELVGSESGLEHYWQFNESSGAMAYDSAGDIDLTLYNMTDDDWVLSTAHDVQFGIETGESLWWNPLWYYRIPVTVTTGDYGSEDYPLEWSEDLAQVRGPKVKHSIIS